MNKITNLIILSVFSFRVPQIEASRCMLHVALLHLGRGQDILEIACLNS